MKALEEQFHDKTLEIYELGKKRIGYNAARFLQKVRRDGGVQAAKSWLNQKSINKPPTGGFLKLVEAGRLDISLEALVLRDPWRSLFTDEELQVAKYRLKEYGYNGNELEDNVSDYLLPEEISEDSGFIEGARKRITVNSYERNIKARTLCIEHYGARCYICEFDFKTTYGSEFSGFIHVHHLRPLSTINTDYRLVTAVEK